MIEDRHERTQLTRDDTTPWAGVLKKAGCTNLGSNPVKSTPPWLLLQVPSLLHFCSDVLQWWTVMKNEAKINPFFPNILLVLVFYYNTRNTNLFWLERYCTAYAFPILGRLIQESQVWGQTIYIKFAKPFFHRQKIDKKKTHWKNFSIWNTHIYTSQHC